MPRPLYSRGRTPVLVVQEAGWVPGPVWTGAENLAPYRDSLPGPSTYTIPAQQQHRTKPKISHAWTSPHSVHTIKYMLWFMSVSERLLLTLLTSKSDLLQVSFIKRTYFIKLIVHSRNEPCFLTRYNVCTLKVPTVYKKKPFLSSS